jgi:hypothetical protein
MSRCGTYAQKAGSALHRILPRFKGVAYVAVVRPIRLAPCALPMREGLLGRAALCRKQLPIHSRDEPKLAAQLAGLAHMVAPLIAERKYKRYDGAGTMISLHCRQTCSLLVLPDAIKARAAGRSRSATEMP